MSARLLVVEAASEVMTGSRDPKGWLNRSLTVRRAGLIQAVVDQARARWERRPGESRFPPIRSEDVCLYSYSPPGNTSHVSPVAMIRRAHHLITKRHLYMSANGEVYRPAVEIPFGDESSGAFEDRLEAGLPGMRFLDTRAYGLLWGIVLRLGQVGVTLFRRVNHERVIALYNAEDRSYFGSLYVRGGRYFVSVNGARSQDVVRGAAHLLAVIRGEA